MDAENTDVVVRVKEIEVIVPTDLVETGIAFLDRMTSARREMVLEVIHNVLPMVVAFVQRARTPETETPKTTTEPHD